MLKFSIGALYGQSCMHAHQFTSITFINNDVIISQLKCLLKLV